MQRSTRLDRVGVRFPIITYPWHMLLALTAPLLPLTLASPQGSATTPDRFRLACSYSDTATDRKGQKWSDPPPHLQTRPHPFNISVHTEAEPRRLSAIVGMGAINPDTHTVPRRLITTRFAVLCLCLCCGVLAHTVYTLAAPFHYRSTAATIRPLDSDCQKDGHHRFPLLSPSSLHTHLTSAFSPERDHRCYQALSGRRPHYSHTSTDSAHP
jgi:hypothetical protein